jgi:5-formyltetrahydrofolate cyclo-ligase
LALREQVLDIGEVPMGEHDWRMDAIITPDEVIGTVEPSL